MKTLDADESSPGQPDVEAHDGIDRRDFLSCMAWAGTGLLWTVGGGVPTSRLFAQTPAPVNEGSFSFVQISDSHIGFSKPANMDVTATLKAAIDKINASQLRHPADLILHTGDVSHISKPAQFDTAEQVIKGAKVERTFMYQGSTIRRSTEVPSITSVLAKEPIVGDGTALTTRASTLWAQQCDHAGLVGRPGTPATRVDEKRCC